MKKKVIAIDVDHVLADSTEALRLVVNERLNVNLLPEHYKIPGDYWNHYEEVWRRHGVDDQISLEDIEPMMEANQSHVLPHRGAEKVLQILSKQYSLIIVTSRPYSWRSATENWLANNFPRIFSKVLFTNDLKNSTPKSKGQLCAENDVSWLIDDNIEHAKSAIGHNINVVLFGDYGWHHKAPADITRCRDWAAVLEYFDGRS